MFESGIVVAASGGAKVYISVCSSGDSFLLQAIIAPANTKIRMISMLGRNRNCFLIMMSPYIEIIK